MATSSQAGTSLSLSAFDRVAARHGVDRHYEGMGLVVEGYAD